MPVEQSTTAPEMLDQTRSLLFDLAYWMPWLNGTELFVLLSLVKSANHHRQAWPSISDIAAETRLQEKVVQITLRRLQQPFHSRPPLIRVVAKGGGTAPGGRSRTTLRELLLHQTLEAK